MRIAGVLLEPFLPARMADLRAALGGGEGSSAGASARAGLAALTRYGAIADGAALAKCALFPRVDPAATAQP